MTETRSLVPIYCDCIVADVCPNGRVGSQPRCVIMKKLEVDMGVEINIGVEKGFSFPSKTASKKMAFWDRTPIPNLRPTEIAYLELLRLPHTDEWRALNQDIFARLREEIADNWQWDSEKVQNHFEDMAYPETRPSEAWETDAAECALATFKKEMDEQDKEQPVGLSQDEDVTRMMRNAHARVIQGPTGEPSLKLDPYECYELYKIAYHALRVPKRELVAAGFIVTCTAFLPKFFKDEENAKIHKSDLENDHWKNVEITPVYKIEYQTTEGK